MAAVCPKTGYETSLIPTCISLLEVGSISIDDVNKGAAIKQVSLSLARHKF